MPSKKISRRTLLSLSSLGAVSGYAYCRGLRYPTLSFTPQAMPNRRVFSDYNIGFEQFIELKANNELGINVDSHETDIQLRAIAPEPTLKFNAQRDVLIHVLVENLSPQAQIVVNESEGGSADVEVEEQSINVISRRLIIKAKANQSINITWKLPEAASYQFAVIGDTGGGDELQWCLQRAHELGALFVLHLGDFNYNEGEYASAITHFKQSPVPCYITIGNHDFHSNGLIYKHFRNQLGRLNNEFIFSGVRFINMDTAADFFPASTGLRGQLFDRLRSDAQPYSDTVLFTHRGLKDPRPGQDHIIGGIGEIEWLKNQLNDLGINTYLSGHVHESALIDVDGIAHYTVGEGMAYQDLVKKKQVANLLMGTINDSSKVTYQWQSINMPWDKHTNLSSRRGMESHGPELLQWYEQTLESND